MPFNNASNISDNCTASGDLVIEQFPEAGTTYPPTCEEWPDCPNSWPPQEVTLKVIDASGNYATRTFWVSFKDDTKPTFTCPPPITQDQDSLHDCGAYINIPAPADLDDNCCIFRFDHNQWHGDGPRGPLDVWLEAVMDDGEIISYNGFFPIGSTTITWTVWDCCGNWTQCEQVVTVHDVHAPTITCAKDMIVPADSGQCQAQVSVSLPAWSDNCPFTPPTHNIAVPPAASIYDASGVYPLGDTFITWTVKDLDNNTAQCTQKITVTDEEAPILCCPSCAVQPTIFTDNAATKISAADLIYKLRNELPYFPIDANCAQGCGAGVCRGGIYDNCGDVDLVIITGFDPLTHEPIEVLGTAQYSVPGNLHLLFLAKDEAGNYSEGDPCDLWIAVIAGGDLRGACCFPEGTCYILTADDCTGLGGTYGGNGTSCSPNPCEQPVVPTGACCINSNCSVMTAIECAGQSGTYQGDGSTCPGNCGSPVVNPPITNNPTPQTPVPLTKADDLETTPEVTPSTAIPVSICGGNVAVTSLLSFVGLIGLTLARRRR